MIKAIKLFLIIIIIFSCNNEKYKLPVLGSKKVIKKNVNGNTIKDTIYYSIPPYALIDQYGDTITAENLKNKIYIADFFFTTCPTICPRMKAQLLRIYKKFYNEDKIMFLSHTIDPKHDTPEILNKYAKKIGITGKKWLFLTGNKDSIFNIAHKYMILAKEDPNAPGGNIHSGAFVLVDTKRRIRGFYDGTNKKEVDNLMDDINILLNEEFPPKNN